MGNSWGWRLFVIGMLLMGVFAMLEPQGESVNERYDADVVYVLEAAPPALVATTGQAHSQACACAAHTTDAKQATNATRAFHMLNFQGRYSLLRSLSSHYLPDRRENESEGRADAHATAPGFGERRIL